MTTPIAVYDSNLSPCRSLPANASLVLGRSGAPRRRGWPRSLSYGPMLTRLERAERTLHAGVFFHVILHGVFVGDRWSFHAARVPVRTPLLTCCDIAGIDDGRVFYLFDVETLNTGFDMAIMYQPLVLQYGQQLDYFPVLAPSPPPSKSASPPHRPVKQFATKPRLHRSALVWFLSPCAVWGGADGLIAGRVGWCGLWCVSRLSLSSVPEARP
ncbi:hypothetical protein B0H13DRAFT_949370 [Mycena leptocephala]|nr:hypothetical protein B0H13DRAFT_949370 [Mycena leptocephala]